MTQKRSHHIVTAGFFSTLATAICAMMIAVLEIPSTLKGTLIGVGLIFTLFVPVYFFTIDRKGDQPPQAAKMHKDRLRSTYRNIVLFLFGALIALIPILILGYCAGSETQCIHSFSITSDTPRF